MRKKAPDRDTIRSLGVQKLTQLPQSLIHRFPKGEGIETVCGGILYGIRSPWDCQSNRHELTFPWHELTAASTTSRRKSAPAPQDMVSDREGGVVFVGLCPDYLSLRTRPQPGVAIPRLEVKCSSIALQSRIMWRFWW